MLCCLIASYNMKTMLILTLHVHQNTFADIRTGNAQPQHHLRDILLLSIINLKKKEKLCALATIIK